MKFKKKGWTLQNWVCFEDGDVRRRMGTEKWYGNIEKDYSDYPNNAEKKKI